MEKKTMIQLTGMWRNRSKAGEDYFSGSLGRGKLLMFENREKRTDKDPDYFLMLAPMDPKPKKEITETEDDLPF